MSKSYWMTTQTGNFSNDGKDTFDPMKRYVGVRLQQAVPLLDRDWNELEDIRRYEEAMLRKWYIGNGSPDDGFKISTLDPAANDFKIAAGRCLVDGFEAVNEPYFNIDVKFEGDLNNNTISEELKGIFETEGYPLSEDAKVAQGKENVWIIKDNDERFIVRKEDETLSVYARYKRYLQQEGIADLTEPKPDETGDEGYRVDTVYLDVWIEEVTSKDDDALKNPDVGIPTCFRHKLEWRVKVDEGTKGHDAEAYHHHYTIATIKRGTNEVAIVHIDNGPRMAGLAVHLLKEATAGLTRLTNNSVVDGLHRHSKLVASDGSPDPALSVDRGGNVGIGTTNPIASLHIKSATGWSGWNWGKSLVADSSDSSPSNPSIGILDETSSNPIAIGNSAGDFTFAAMPPLNNNTTPPAVLMTIKKNGNVGIGRQDPISKLHIKASPRQVPLILDYDGKTEWTPDTIKTLFESLPNNSVIIGSPDGGTLPFFWKDANGETWYAGLNGERFRD